jgi:superfamily II DNA helicase RecQ
VHDVTIKELREENPRIRLVLSTSITGMGFDPPCVVRIIHACPPRNLSQYFQEIGCAGRRGQAAEAIMHFNGHDLGKNLPGIQDDIIRYCKNPEGNCLRELLLETFGFKKD